MRSTIGIAQSYTVGTVIDDLAEAGVLRLTDPRVAGDASST